MGFELMNHIFENDDPKRTTRKVAAGYIPAVLNLLGHALVPVH